MKRIAATALLFLSTALLTGCGSKAAESPTVVASGDAVVDMKNIRFSPAKLTVKKGAKITFVNKDGVQHDVLQVTVKDLGKQTPSFQSPVIMPGQDWSIVMEKTGTYPILCAQMGHFTAGMVGTIEVVD